MRPRPTILIVDDEESVRTYLSLVLRSLGCHVLEARTGSIAIKASEKQLPDLAIIDLNMPERDGKRVIEDLQSRWPGMQVLVITGGDTSGVPEGTPILTKPFSPAELRIRVSRLLEGVTPRQVQPYLNVKA